MQTCTQCNTQSPDNEALCQNCGADLSVYSTSAVALQKFQQNARVKLVRISVASDACPACQKLEGVYEKDQVPSLPVEGCSHENGCRCFYAPILEEIYP